MTGGGRYFETKAAELQRRVAHLEGLILGLKDRYDGVPCTHCCPHCPWCDNGLHEMVDGAFVHGPECKAFTPEGELK